MTLAAGARLGRYVVVAPLGAGATGAVYRAHDTRLGRDVAVKVIPQADRDTQSVYRLAREAQAASSLNHHNIVTVHDVGEAEGCGYLVMELVEGRTLRELAAERITFERMCDIGHQAAVALARAHEAGIVHRDIKPENVMVRADGYVKVLDFGLARVPEGVNVSSETAVTMTQPGIIVGTIAYMSPQQARGEPLTAASDVFSLGLVLYELATDRHPFRAASVIDTLNGITSAVPVPPSRLRPEIGAAFDALIARMLAKDPRDRPSAAEVAAMLVRPAAPLEDQSAIPARPRAIVGRDAERRALAAALDDARGGRGVVMALAGEPGLGKTTLAEDFLIDAAAGPAAIRTARGRCSERLAGAEAYLPWLEALDSLLRADGTGSVASLMKTIAPVWYAQVASPDAAASAPHEVPEIRSGSQERLKRELTAFLEHMSRAQPVVLLLDDLHWADESTVDLLAYVAGRLDAKRLLIIVTYRGSDLARTKHPFGPLRLELESRGQCRTVELSFLRREDAQAYLDLEFPHHRFPPELAPIIHSRTDGNPLFLVDLVRDFRGRSLIVEDAGVWHLAGSTNDVEGDLPASVRSMVDRKLLHLNDSERRLLQAASVQGHDFDSVIVARALGEDPADIEERLDALARVHVLVRPTREVELPDRSVTLKYSFVHALYQNALFASLGPSRRLTLSRSIAEALDAAYVSQRETIAGELALLYVAARQADRAAQSFLDASRRAARLFAAREAIALARRGLGELASVPASRARDVLEFDLLIALGTSLQAAEGFSAPETHAVFERATALCERIGDLPRFFTFYGIGASHLLRANLHLARDFASKMVQATEDLPDPTLNLMARFGMGTTLSHMGDWPAAHEVLEKGAARYDAQGHRRSVEAIGWDAGLGCGFQLGRVLWSLGAPDRGLASARQHVEVARRAGRHPFTMAFGLFFLAWIHQLRREVDDTLAVASEAIQLSQHYGFPVHLAWCQALVGWAHVERGATDDGISQMREALELMERIGTELIRPQFLGDLSWALSRQDRPDEARSTLRAAIGAIERTDERCHEPELYRIEADILLRHTPPTAERDGEAESLLVRALAVTRAQHARSLELRAATSLARLRASQGRAAEGREIVAPVYHQFAEGLDTPDLIDARAILSE